MNNMISCEPNRFKRLAGELARLKADISMIIDEGLDAGLDSQRIVDQILTKAVVDNELVLDKEGSAERPINIAEILLIAQKAVEQASFEGVFVALPSGGRIKRRNNNQPVTC